MGFDGTSKCRELVRKGEEGECVVEGMYGGNKHSACDGPGIVGARRWNAGEEFDRVHVLDGCVSAAVFNSLIQSFQGQTLS